MVGSLHSVLECLRGSVSVGVSPLHAMRGIAFADRTRFTSLARWLKAGCAAGWAVKGQRNEALN